MAAVRAPRARARAAAARGGARCAGARPRARAAGPRRRSARAEGRARGAEGGDDEASGLRIPTGTLLPVLTLPALLPALPDLDGPLSTLESVGVLAAIIAVHEAGHFAAARLQGIHVSQFSIGFGPSLLEFKAGEVEYGLRAFPIGGYVAFPDDEPECPYPEDDPDLLRNRPAKDRALVISAGVIANVVFAMSTLLTQVSTVGLAEQIDQPGVLVPGVAAKSVAAEAGIKEGDVILELDGVSLPGGQKSVRRVVETIKDSDGTGSVRMTLSRDGSTFPLEVIPAVAPDGSGRVGVTLGPNALIKRTKAENPAEAVFLAAKEFGRLTKGVTDGLGQIFFHFGENKDAVSGPVAIVAVGADIAKKELSGLYEFAAAVNINLAVVNMLPLPALDGGYLALIALEAVRGGDKLPKELEQGIMNSGFLLLLTAGMFLIVKDTIGLVS